MNTFLISVGAAIIAALLAAFIAPVFIDWNGYRDRIEAEARALLCRKVEIAGDLDVRLLPEPVITTGHVEIAGGEDEVLMSAAGSSLRLSLQSLLLGDLELTALELDRPVFTFSSDENGILNWASTAKGAEGCQTGLEQINVRNIGITNGIAAFKSASMTAPVTIGNIDARISAGRPAGPYKLTGAYGPADGRLGLSISSGRINPGASTRVNGRIALDERTKLSFDGVADGWNVPLHFSGSAKVEHMVPGAGEAVLALKAEAKAQIGLGSAEFSELQLTANEDGTSSTATGSARIDFGEGAPNVAIELKSRRIDTDRLFGRDTAQNSDLAALLSLVDDWVAKNRVIGRVSLSVDGALYRNELVRNLVASINLGAENIGIETMTAVLPGQSEFDFSGNFLRSGSGGKLLGTVVLNTRDLKRLLDWAVPPDQRRFVKLMPLTRGKLSVTGGLRSEAGAIELTGIEGLIDESPFSGDMSLSLGEPGEVYAALSFDELNLDRMVPRDFDPMALVAARGDKSEPVLPEFGLEIEARRVKWRGREIRGLTGSGGMSGSRLAIEYFRIEDVAGGRVSGEGKVRFGSNGPEGRVDFGIESEDLPAVAAFFGADLAQLFGRQPYWLARIRKGRLKGHLQAGQKDGNWNVGAAIKGEIEGTQVSATVASDGAPENVTSGRIVGALKLEHADAGQLIAQLGLSGLPDTTPNAAGKLIFDATGSVQSGFGYSLTFAGFDANAVAEGSIEIAPARISGQLSLDARDSNRIADLVGVGALAPVLPATQLAMGYDLKGGVLELTLATGKIAGVNVSGRGRLQIAGARSGEVSLDLEMFSLPWALSSLFASHPPPTVADPAGAGGRWSTDLIDTTMLDRWPVAVKINADRLTLAGGIVLTEAKTDVSIGDGQLKLTTLEGKLASDGSFRAKGKILKSDLSLTVDGMIEADGLSLGRFYLDQDSRPLLDGLVGIDVQFKAGGRSLLSLVSSLGGKGSVTLNRAVLPRLDAARLLNRLGRAGNAEAIDAMVRGGQDGATQLDIDPSPLVATNGRIKIGPSKVASGELTGQVTSFVSLVGGRIDQEVLLSSGGKPRIAVIHAGGFATAGREIELSGANFGPVHWREPAAERSGPTTDHTGQPAENTAVFGKKSPASTSNIATELTVRGVRKNPDGPPVGVIEEKVFELPLAGGG